MSLIPPRPNPSQNPPPRRRPARPKAAGPMPGWGWLEWFAASQTFFPALLFIPGITPVRTATRVAAYVVALVAWAGVASRDKRADKFPAKMWLLACILWLTASLAHPNNYSIKTAVGQVLLYVAVMSPAFWAGEALNNPRQIRRVMAVLFLCNAASATIGLGQVFYPNRLNPPDIPALRGIYQGEDLMFETTDGRRILRPCGLTDTPGAASSAGAAAALIGLCFAIRPGPLWRRLACLGLAFVGVAVIYYTQVRTLIVMLTLCVAVLAALLIYQRNLRSAVTLLGGGTAVIVGSLYWVARTMGSRVFERFGTLLSSNPASLYQSSRGAYVTHSLTTVLIENPLGYGLGWWGMVYASFGDPRRVSPVWVEVMIPAWIVDGGLPLLLAYGGAIVVAMADSLRIALTCRDKELGFWAAVVVAQNLSLVANCFGFVTFLTPFGLQFWLLAAALHAADAQTRAAARPGGPAAAAPRPARRAWPWQPGAAAR